jgi:hypothetical protein
VVQKLRLRKLKAWAADSLPAASILRNVILSTPDEVDSFEFFGLARAWQQLVDLEQENENDRPFTAVQHGSKKRPPRPRKISGNLGVVK